MDDPSRAPLGDEDMLVVSDPSMVRPCKGHSWFGLPEIVGYVAFVVLATMVGVGIAPEMMRKVADSPMLAVLRDVRPENGRILPPSPRYPGGLVSVDLKRVKIRKSHPLAVLFYVVNSMTAAGDKGIRVLPFRSLDDRCEQLDEETAFKLKTYPVGPIDTHWCFEIPLQARGSQIDIGVRGEFLHSAWPFFGLAPIVTPIPEFRPVREGARAAD